METSLRNTSALIARIEGLRNELIKRFENLVGVTSDKSTDRTLTAVTQYQMQVETSALIRAAEDFQTLIRQLQEMWLFGQLDTMGASAERRKADENAAAVAEMLAKLVDGQNAGVDGGDGSVNRHANGDGSAVEGEVEMG